MTQNAHIVGDKHYNMCHTSIMTTLDKYIDLLLSKKPIALTIDFIQIALILYVILSVFKSLGAL